MEDIAELIVKKAQAVPIDAGIALTCNNARIAKVAVTGGLGLEVTYEGKTLLFPMAEMKTAVQSFMTAAHLSGADADSTPSSESGSATNTSEMLCVRPRASLCTSPYECV